MDPKKNEKLPFEGVSSLVGRIRKAKGLEDKFDDFDDWEHSFIFTFYKII